MHDLRALPVQHCHLLTGTPLQNSTTELWSLLHFLDPAAFASLDTFLAEFGQSAPSRRLTALALAGNGNTILQPSPKTLPHTDSSRPLRSSCPHLLLFPRRRADERLSGGAS